MGTVAPARRRRAGAPSMRPASTATARGRAHAGGRRDRGQAQDPEPRPEPLRALDHAPGRLRLDPDHHAGRQPRLGRLGHGGRHRPRHRVRRRRRALPRGHLRLRPGPLAEQRSRRAGPGSIKGVVDGRQGLRAHQRAAGRPARHDLGRAGGRQDRQAHPEPLGHPDRPHQRATRSSGWDRATPTAPSPSPTCRPATTRSPGGTSGSNYILDLVNVTVGDGETVDMGILPLDGLVDLPRGLRLQRPQPERRQGSRASRASPTTRSRCASARTR